MITIPSGKKWSQTNSGEVFGMLHASKNISFDRQGYAQLSKKPTATVYNVTNFETLVSCNYIKASSNSGYYAMTAAHPFRFNLDGSVPTDLNGAGHTGSIFFDGVPWQQRWYISQDVAFDFLTISSGAWNGALGTLTTGVPHPMCVWESANCLAIGNDNKVEIYNTSHTKVVTVVLPSNFQVRWIRYNHNRIYVGTKNTLGGDAVVFVCSDSTSSSAADAWPVPANWVFSGIAYKSSITVVTSRGQLLWFNGGGWTELANLPVYYTTYSWYQGVGYTNGRMEQRGMATDGNLIFLNIDGYVGDDSIYLESQPSGLWVYDPAIGLTHRAGVSLDKYQTISITSGSTNTTTDVFTAGSSFTALTGVKVWYKATTVSTGLENYRYYYLIRKSSTTFQLATTYANAIAGTAIDITAAGGTEALHYNDELDAGGFLGGATEAGAVCLVSELDSFPLANATGYGYMTGSQVLYGMSNIPNTDSSGTLDLVLTLTPSYNRGYIVTQKIFSDNARDSFRGLIAKMSRMFQTSDKGVFKYRIVDKLYYPLSTVVLNAMAATWVNGTSFTTSRDCSMVSVGEEVEFTGGRAGGLTAHVSITPTYSAGTGLWTITLDETIPGVSASDKSGFVIQNWIKLKSPLLSTDPNWLYHSNFPEGAKKWIQFKFEFRGHSEPILEGAMVDNAKKE